MATVRVVVDREIYVTDPGDPPEVEWGNRESTAGYISSVDAYLVGDVTHPKARSRWRGLDEDYELDIKRGDTVYAIIADYDTGDTFGRDGNQVQVVACFAEEYRASILLSKLKAADSNAYTLEYEGENYYISWNGYFEHLNTIDIYPLVVR